MLIVTPKATIEKINEKNVKEIRRESKWYSRKHPSNTKEGNNEELRNKI